MGCWKLLQNRLPRFDLVCFFFCFFFFPFVFFKKDASVLFFGALLHSPHNDDRFSFACNYLKCLPFNASLLGSSAFPLQVDNGMQCKT